MMNVTEGNMSFRWGWAVMVLAALLLVACESDDTSTDEVGDEAGDEAGDETGSDAMIEIMGMGDNDWGTAEEITSEVWNGTDIVSYSNEDNWVITQNAAEQPEDSYAVVSAFNKIVWTDVENDTFYYCWVAWDLATLEEAEAAENIADASDLTEAGCGGSSWTMVIYHEE
jgi:hypothetical protein